MLEYYFTNKSLYAWEEIAKEESFSKEVEEPERRKKIAKGDIIDLHDLLFTKNRDYLVRYQDNQHVKAEHLAAKVIVIYFTPQVGHDISRYYVPLLENIYINLYPHDGFEVVFVAVKDVDHDHLLSGDFCKHLEEEIFSLRPWTAIPLSDSPSEQSLQRRGFPEISRDSPTVLIVDSMGMVLQCDDAYYILELYGALGFPFSDERIKYLESEDDAIAIQPSLQTLLASPQRDYLISNTGDKAEFECQESKENSLEKLSYFCFFFTNVRLFAQSDAAVQESAKLYSEMFPFVPIHTLEDKVVALYFYEDGFTDDYVLKRAYEKLKKDNQNFEVVLIYTPNISENKFYCASKESFWRTFKTMPWLALPFKDPNETKLKRILEYSLAYMEPHNDPNDVTRLVIFGPRCEFIEPFGANILDRFDLSAYPFTFVKVVELEIEKVNDMKLEMLWDRNTVFTGKDGSEVPVSQLAGKNVIVFYESCYINFYKMEFLKMLKEKYVQCKGTSDEFEVIHIMEKEIGVSKHIGYLPWLVSELLPAVDRNFFYVHSLDMSFVFFDGNGRVVRKTILPSFENTDFPFCADGLEKEAWAQLNVMFDWKSWYGSHVPCFGRPRIYSLEKMNAPTSLRLCKF
ncbi:hypothetical protein OROHE_010242 [Orobanche hederae]